MNDCLAFKEDEIGVKKYFVRTFFIKRSREENMRKFEEMAFDPPKLINYPFDCDGEESKIII